MEHESDRKKKYLDNPMIHILPPNTFIIDFDIHIYIFNMKYENTFSTRYTSLKHSLINILMGEGRYHNFIKYANYHVLHQYELIYNFKY